MSHDGADKRSQTPFFKAKSGPSDVQQALELRTQMGARVGEGGVSDRLGASVGEICADRWSRPITTEGNVIYIYTNISN
jgi:hypothetical protein